MTQAAVSELDERVPGRRWTVRLDAASRGSAAVRISCSRPACTEQRLPSAAAGRAAAVAHLTAHLRAAPAPRAGAYCACKADGCHTHLPDTGRHARAEPWRCGGPVVLAVITDREGRWWHAMECCSRCAAATPGAKTAATSQAPGPQTTGRPARPRSHGRKRGCATVLRPPGRRQDGGSSFPLGTCTASPATGEDRPADHPPRPAADRLAGRTHRTR